MSQDPTQDFYESYAQAYEERTKCLQPVDAIKKFMELLPPGGTILDIGCAAGRDSNTFIKNGFVVTGIDYSNALIKRAQKNVPNATFLVQDIRNLDLPEKSFDGIWASASLLHVEKKELPGVLKNLHSLLKTNGTLFMSLKEGSGETISPDDRYDGAKKFFSYFSEAEAMRFAKDADFELIEHSVSPSRSEYNKSVQWIWIFARRKHR